jgi:L-ascorbate oxidase
MSARIRFPSSLQLLGLASVMSCASAVMAAEVALSSGAEATLKKHEMQVPARLVERKAILGRRSSERDKYEKSYDLCIQYADGHIFNPNTGKEDKVRLRSYQPKMTAPSESCQGNVQTKDTFVAPTVVMEPGQTVRFKLGNQLPVLNDCDTTAINLPRKPGCFNVTNLHSHGLWVSPSGNSDNVLLSIQPGVAFEYEYNVPVDHPAGTFWYHPHVHGTTAMQVASGMAGALIVEGKRDPTKYENGDIDTLLTKFAPQKLFGGIRQADVSGEVMLLEQIPYACFEKTIPPYTSRQTTWKIVDDKKTEVGPWTCQPNDTGVVENFNQVESPSVWRTSGRNTLVNGQVQPVITLQQNQVYRWRMIDAGFQDTVKLRIKQITDSKRLDKFLNQDGSKTTTPQTDFDGAGLCDGIDIWQFEVASDGLTHDKIIQKTTNYLQPGYRSDILFSLPNAGYYCVYDEKADSALNNGAAKNARLLAIIRNEINVRESLPPPQARFAACTSLPAGSTERNQCEKQATFMLTQLVQAADKYDLSISETVKKDLLDDLKLTRFVPHPPITQAEIDKSSQLPILIDFKIVGNGDNKPTQFMVNNSPFQAGRMDQTMILNTTQTWKLSSSTGSHPFHIHVNPFQIKKITPKACPASNAPPTNPYCLPYGTKDEDQYKYLDPQYKDLIGTWKDTLLVTGDVNIEVATRYERYIGEFVMHCHILEHEDQGMMQNVRVVLPGGDVHAGH